MSSDSEHDDTNTTPTPAPQGSDPIRPAHYRDPDTGRDRIAVWCATMGAYDFVAAIGATVDRYLSRAGRKPGVSAEQDRAKAAEVARRYFEEWGEGADELLGELLSDLGHDREAIDDLLLSAARPRTATASTTQAEVTPHPHTVGEWCAAEWARDAALQLLPQGWKMRPGKHGYPEFVGKRDDRPAAIVWRGGNTSWRWAFDDPQDRSREVACAIDGIREADAALRAAPAEVTPQQAAAIPPDRPFPADVHFNVDRYGPEWLWSVQIIERRTIAEGSETTEDEARSKAKAAHMAYEAQQAAGARPLPTREQLAAREAQQWHTGVAGLEVTPIVRDGDLTAEGRALLGMTTAPQANPLAGVALLLTPNELHALAWLVVRAGGFTDDERRAEHAIISAAQRCGWPNEAQPPSAQDDHAAALQRERERADRAERALRLERGAPLLGDLPEGWAQLTGDDRSYGCDHATVVFVGAYTRKGMATPWEAAAGLWYTKHATAAEAIDAAHAALTAQRSDDTARDDGSDSSASGEGDSALPPDGYDWHDGAGDTEVLTDEHEEAAAWITRSTLPGGADQWSWWLASDSTMGVEKDVRHESTWKAARIGVRRAIEKRSSDSSAAGEGEVTP